MIVVIGCIPDSSVSQMGIVYVCVGAGVSVGGKRVTVDDDEAVGFDRSDVGGESSEVSRRC